MKLFKIHESDNVAVAIETIGFGECVETGGETVRANMEIPAGHKIALADIGEGEAVVKYGEHIGVATAPIAKGAHVHVHNVVSPQEDRQAKE